MNEQAAQEKTCFVIMPITVPEKRLNEYRDDIDHFAHVYEHLFVPAISEARYEPQPPITEGSQVIHGDIGGKLHNADLVLCDMSMLNPNVFMELGMRIALDKPLCVVRDELLMELPFDLKPLNCHEYQSVMDPWILKEEIPKLTEHIKKTTVTENQRNPLWKVFGLTAKAEAPAPGSLKETVELILREVLAIREDRKESGRSFVKEQYRVIRRDPSTIKAYVERRLGSPLVRAALGIKDVVVLTKGKIVDIIGINELSNEEQKELAEDIWNEFGYVTRFQPTLLSSLIPGLDKPLSEDI